MVVLHIASIREYIFNGVTVVVPQHVIASQSLADTALLNLTNYPVLGIENQLSYDAKVPFSVRSLPQPFNKPDIVIFHECYIGEFLKIYKNLIQEKVPYIIIPHGELAKQAQRKKWLKKKVANLLLFNRFIKNSKAIQCLSVGEFHNTQYKHQKIIATNGISIGNEYKEEFHTERIDFVYIGRMEVYTKGLDLLLQAVKRLKNYFREKNVHLYIYGPPYGKQKKGYKHADELVTEYALADIVTINAPVQGEEKKKILLESDIFIQTSRFEGMPMGILEAFSYGLPCLITRGTSLGDYAEEYNAGWVAENNVDSIVEKIRETIDNRNTWKEKSENARRLVTEKFAWQKIAKKTLKIYEELISSKS